MNARDAGKGSMTCWKSGALFSPDSAVESEHHGNKGRTWSSEDTQAYIFTVIFARLPVDS
jgi:hypothetical protein